MSRLEITLGATEPEYMEFDLAAENGDTEVVVDIAAWAETSEPSSKITLHFISDALDGDHETARFILPDGWRLLNRHDIEISTDLGLETDAYLHRSLIKGPDGQTIKVTGLLNGALSQAPCFTRGVLIRTPKGDVPVETLEVGDLVVTRDHGPQPILWRGTRRFSLLRADKFGPVIIGAGALGAGRPSSDLVVSRQHRILLRSAVVGRMTGTDEVLVAAKDLLSLQGVALAPTPLDVEYHHIMFASHEVVFANGAETESFYVGEQAEAGLGAATYRELVEIFPALATGHHPVMSPARPILGGRRTRTLIERHLKNRKPVVAS